MFKEVPSQFDFPKAEKETLRFWEENKIYEKSLANRKGGKSFVFFEGPPTANGLPHPGHCLTRAIKDLFPRFKTMTGHYVLRKGGWDTHGLPVEVEVCKELGIHTKEEIEAYGVEAFNRKCLESVFRYTKEWEELTKRLGFWVNLEEAYVTYHQSYIESVWWSLKQLFDAGLLYQGHKIVWWWAQGGTALSAGEVGQGYREVDDPSVYVRFPIVMDEQAKKAGIPDKTSLLVWTTTPWTLPSNMYAAVHKDIDYAFVHDEETGERLILAATLIDQIAKKVKKTEKWKVEKTLKGGELIGLRYRPPFGCYYDQPVTKLQVGTFEPTADTTTPVPVASDYKAELENGDFDYIAWRVLHADFVTLESGTGLVHEAPAFGEVDYELLKKDQDRIKYSWDVPFLCAVAPNGKFTDEGPEYCRGRFVKDCDKDITRDLKDRGLLLHQEQYRHDYPFCWRAEEDPLIQYPRRSWFIRTTQFKDAMLENNSRINWLPDHIKEGRFGNFLRDNVDWSLSRERYWGTPLPIWVCDACNHMEAVDSYDALVAKLGVAGLEVWENAKKKEPTLSDHLKVHKPYIDAITYACPKCVGSAVRTDPPQVEDSTRRTSSLKPQASQMHRVPEVIDCWYDSGAMPFAQWGYPHKNAEMFASQFPADFISEALDQTRGWFYSLTAISTLLFGKDGVAMGGMGKPSLPVATREEPTGKQSLPMPPQDYPHPFRNCIVLGLL
ncbi:MAG: isoleucine--tRNA ligase, partial [Planctomycetota bacterium]